MGQTEWVMVVGDTEGVEEWPGPCSPPMCCPPPSAPRGFPDSAKGHSGRGRQAGDSGVWAAEGLPRAHHLVVERWETSGPPARAAHGECSPFPTLHPDLGIPGRLCCPPLPQLLAELGEAWVGRLQMSLRSPTPCGRLHRAPGLGRCPGGPC